MPEDMPSEQYTVMSQYNNRPSEFSAGSGPLIYSGNLPMVGNRGMAGSTAYVCIGGGGGGASGSGTLPMYNAEASGSGTLPTYNVGGSCFATLPAYNSGGNISFGSSTSAPSSQQLSGGANLFNINRSSSLTSHDARYNTGFRVEALAQWLAWSYTAFIFPPEHDSLLCRHVSFGTPSSLLILPVC